jgi:hypothetical protein
MTINYTPPANASLHSDLVFTVYDDKSLDPATYPDYKYIADVYIGGVFRFRAKAFPNPENKRGIFNIAPVVRSYLSGVTLSPNNGIFCQTFDSGKFFIDVQVKFGEEYDFITYPNVLSDSSRLFYNHYDAILADYFNKPATNRPARVKLKEGALNYFIPYLPNTTSVLLTLTKYNALGTSTGTTASTFTVVSGNLYQLNFSSSAIESDFPFFISGAASFKATFLSGGVTRDIIFSYDCDLYDNYPVHFLNQLGGFDTFNFSKVSKKSYQGERKTFTQLPYRMGADGVVSYLNSKNVKHEEKTTFATSFTESLLLTTDILTDHEHRFLKELLFSPLVYVQIGGTMYPVHLKANNYEEKRYITDKLQPLQIELELRNLNSQYR